MKPIDYTNHKQGRLSVIGRAPNHKGLRAWNCQCSCGKTTIRTTASLAAGTESCGCLQREIARARNLKHGACQRRGKPTEYVIWTNMIQRCTNPNNPAFPDYGGRGVSVCSRWMDYSLFFEDMGTRPRGLTLNRVDNDGNYEPSNCQWSTAKEQGNNTRCNVVLTLEGKTQTATQWGEQLGVNPRRILERKRLGWSDEQSLMKPPRKTTCTRYEIYSAT